LGDVEQMLGTFGRAQGMDTFSNPFMNQLRAIAAGRPLQSARAGPRSPLVEGVASPASRGPDPIVAALAEVRRLLSIPPVDSRRVFAVVTRAIKLGLRLHSCLVFLREAHGPLFGATVGSGAFFEAIRNQPLLDPHQKDVFTVCLNRGEDVMIQDPDDPRILPFIPDWFQRVSSKGPFVLLPIKDSEGTFAIICGTTGRAERIELNATRLQQLKSLRCHLGAIRSAVGNQRAAA
jgi:hypothetical protein